MTEVTNTAQVDIQAQPEKRILVLGSSPHSQLIDAYAWDSLPEKLNVSDYDVVILNLVPLLNEELSLSVDIGRLPTFEQFSRFLFSHNSELIVIGFPEILVGEVGHQYNPISYWLPALPQVVFESGEQIRNVDPEFAYYFNQVSKWHFFTTDGWQSNQSMIEHYLPLVHRRGNDLRAERHSVAQTRTQHSIAFKLKFRVIQTQESVMYGHELEPAVLKESGEVIWLPPATEITHYDAVNLVLRNRYGITFEVTSPTWTNSYKLPRQIPIEQEIEQYKTEIENLEQKMAEAQERLKEESRFIKLLYEQGEDGLENAVREAFRELGVVVIEPAQRGREDGRLTAPSGQICMLEIKGRKNQLRLADVRQLDQWVRDALINEGIDSKGILIANLFCEHTLELRTNPFPPNCVEAAERSRQCLMLSTQLFRAVCSHQRGELDLQVFWEAVLNTNGICSLPHLEPVPIRLSY